MKFSDFVKTDSIKTGLTATDKQDVIRELIAGLVEQGHLDANEQENVVAAVLKREELGSTGIGRGIAVPHTKHASVDDLIGTVGISSEGVEFDSLDGEKVNIFFLLISPTDRPGDHLRALENISRQLHNDTFCRFLKQAQQISDVEQVLDEADNNQFV